MPSDTGNPQNASQHNPRHPKDTSYEASHRPLNPQNFMDTATPKKAGKVKRPNRSQHSASKLTQASDQENKMDPLTPPRPITQAMSTSTDAPISVAMSAKGKKKTNRTQSNGQAFSSSPATTKERSPRTDSSKISMTPARASATPIQAYAGPTFHASPAPSALPIPKFFTKSLSPAEKSPSPKAVTQDHSSETSSMKSGDSPTITPSLRVGEDRTRDASPLDIFFKADREEKAKRQLGTPLTSENGRTNSNQTSNTAFYAPISSGSVPGPWKHHSRNAMESPLSNVLPSEMDATERPKPTHVTTTGQHPDAYRSKTSPSIMTTRTETDEQRKAKSLALKKLLMSPKPQLPPSGFTTGNIASGSPAPHSPSPSPRPSQPIRHLAGLSTSTHSNSLPNNFPRSTQQRTSSPPINQFTPILATRPSQRRTSSSYLCQELSSDSLNLGNGSPSTPTPYRSRNVHNPAIPFNNLSTQSNHNIPSPANGCSPFEARANIQSDPVRNNGNLEIEDALRRVLKLDILGSEGATGVRS